jgi:hypothetical protein
MIDREKLVKDLAESDAGVFIDGLWQSVHVRVDRPTDCDLLAPVLVRHASPEVRAAIYAMLCPNCEATGEVRGVYPECCGRANGQGECCGEAIPVEGVEPCDHCGGSGLLAPAPTTDTTEEGNDK